MRAFIIIASLLLSSQWGFAAPKTTNKLLTAPEAPMAIQRGQARRLFVVGFQGSVSLTAAKGDEVLVRASKYINSDDLAPGDTESLSQLVIKTNNLGDTIEVRTQLPPSASDWAKWAQGKRVPSAHLEILAPDNMNLEIYLTRGDVKVYRWKAAVTITSQEGKIDVEDITGDVTVRSMYGAVKTENIKGNVAIENFTSHISAENITGKLHIKNFAGDTLVKKVDGPINLSSQKGGVSSQETTGSMEVQTGIAAIHIADHKGSLTGHSDSGSITAHVLGPVETRLSSNTGPLSLTLAHGADATVSMYSAKGNLSAPSSLESKRSPSGKSVRGALGGGQGHVHLSSDSGDLFLKAP